MMAKLALGAAGVASAAITIRVPDVLFPSKPRISPQNQDFLELIARTSFEYFREFSHPRTGMVKDAGRLVDRRDNNVSSIAATGFGLTALCIADANGWMSHAEALERTRNTLRFLWNKLPHQRGFYYHFVDWQTGKRVWQSEVSSIDTAILLCGALTARTYFDDPETIDLASKIYERIDWRWMHGEGPFLRHGWTPENGFLRAKWDSYSEHMLLYLLAIGARNHAIPSESWHSWSRPQISFGGYDYIDTDAPLFIHQYSHAWFDFRGQQDKHADYHRNSMLATLGHRQFCHELGAEFPQYSDELWGITASSSPQGYVVWGGPPRRGPIDGTLVPCAAGGSLPFLNSEATTTLLNMKNRFGEKVWTRLGFVDAFNPGTGWVAREFLGINTGITLLMAENSRTGMVWETFMRNPETCLAMERCGFKPIELT